jgi:hypothetical protein
MGGERKAARSSKDLTAALLQDRFEHHSVKCRAVHECRLFLLENSLSIGVDTQRAWHKDFDFGR